MHNIMESKGQTLILILFRSNNEISTCTSNFSVSSLLSFSFAIFLFHFKRPQETRTIDSNKSKLSLHCIRIRKKLQFIIYASCIFVPLSAHCYVWRQTQCVSIQVIQFFAFFALKFPIVCAFAISITLRCRWLCWVRCHFFFGVISLLFYVLMDTLWWSSICSEVRLFWCRFLQTFFFCIVHVESF